MISIFVCAEERRLIPVTQNQIAYWTLQETKRSNAEREAETKRANVAKETETNRSNVANEGIKRMDTIWSNVNDSVATAGKVLENVAKSVSLFS